MSGPPWQENAKPALSESEFRKRLN